MTMLHKKNYFFALYHLRKQPNKSKISLEIDDKPQFTKFQRESLIKLYFNSLNLFFTNKFNIFFWPDIGGKQLGSKNC